MIHVDAKAQAYFARLLARQGEEIVGIHLSAVAPGTATADVALRYCERDDLVGDEWQVDVCEGLSFYIDADSAPWLDQAQIQMKSDGSGGEQLSIRAPALRATAPSAQASLVERVRWLLESEINPQLASHGGRVALEEITGDGTVVLRFGGGCQGCGMVSVTLREGIERTLRERCPEITAVVDATDHARGQTPYYAAGSTA
jgi:Fe/S biogenesis protein NfuA